MFPTNTIVNKIVFALIIIFVLVYGVLRASGVLYGPHMTLSLPASGTEVHQQLISISGAAQHVVHLDVNGKELLVDEKGNFTHTLLLAPGVNHLTFTAEDKFGKKNSKTITIVYTPPNP